ncbi:MAG: hypothetical protein JW955_12660 [Sedimentisphaerales bacterium]|nr:hypothetical protein [Sedimentisphaerales bacterium]
MATELSETEVHKVLGEPRVWKVRTIKNYPEAHNHILVGKVLEITDSYVRMHCRTYHFGPTVNGPEDVLIGTVMVRVIPWSRIEVINELPADYDYIRSTLIGDKAGQVLFKDARYASPIGRSPEPTY